MKAGFPLVTYNIFQSGVRKHAPCLNTNQGKNNNLSRDIIKWVVLCSLAAWKLQQPYLFQNLQQWFEIQQHINLFIEITESFIDILSGKNCWGYSSLESIVELFSQKNISPPDIRVTESTALNVLCWRKSDPAHLSINKKRSWLFSTYCSIF